MADKGDLRKRFTGDRQAPPRGAKPADDYEKMAAELADSVGKTVKVATTLGLMVAETVGAKVMELLGPVKSAPRSSTTGRARDTATTAFTSAKEKLPDFNAETASKLTDFVVTRGVAALRAVQQTVQKTRRPG